MTDQKPDLSKIPFADLKAMRNFANDLFEYHDNRREFDKAKIYIPIVCLIDAELNSRLTDLFPELKK